MNLYLKSSTVPDAAEWDHIWENCDYATYFHSREWAEVWQRYSHRKLNPAPRLITFSDGKKALLPFSCHNKLKGLIHQFISSPAGTFGGWISIDNLSENHFSILFKYITDNYKNIVWRINPYDSFSDCIKNLADIMQDDTHALNLKGGFDSIQNYWANKKDAVIRKATKAKKHGIIIKKTKDHKEWKSYYDIYLDSINRWGPSASSRYSWQLFQELFSLSSPNISLWLAYYENKIISGALCFYAKKHVVYWHGASLSEYFNFRPVNLLMYEIIKDACERGFEWFDFNPSGGHEGVRAFKKSFGALELPSPVIYLKDTKAKIIEKALKIVRSITK
ncbi:MAG: GNAT family N-acetyltransferase [candidate division KSB1 bacterium]|nr:GNAT family N-acetyltransferase [candidate division KSB1 bacterium]MDZ7400708.1 GNAT family N-acetyltransferase [candidate division KSB1 bacterium]